MTKEEFKKKYIKARKALISKDFSHLNDMQRQAVLATEGPLLILAGAGSGKTTVLINRVANLLRYGRGSDTDEVSESAGEAELAVLEAAVRGEPGCDIEKARRLAAVEPCEPWRIIAITFTNKAANELKTRLEAMLGEAALDVWAQTFHSACVRILRRCADKLGYGNNFTIYDTTDSRSVMKHIIKDLDLDEKAFPERTVLSYISKAKDEYMTADEFAAQARAIGDVRREKIAECFSAYDKRLKDANAMDFDDLIFNTVRILEQHEDVRGYYQRLFKYVLIDEYQDTNILQYRLAALLCGDRQNICVVGDDDQSIYKFRGATIENILSFEQQFKNARVIRLEQNYRSVGNILSAANAVIRRNVNRKGKELWTDKDSGQLLTVYVAQNENDEAQYVAGQILDAFSEGENWRDNAVLYRLNAQSNKLEYALKRSGIPYKVFGGTRFFDRAEIKDMLSYLCAIAMPQDDLRLMRIINTPPRGIGDKTVETALRLAAQDSVPLWEVVTHAERYEELGRASGKLKAFADMLSELQAMADDTPLDELYDILVERTGYAAALLANNTDENRARLENIQELKSNIISYIRDTGDGGLAGFLDEVALYTDLDSLDQNGECVTLMTMHMAKGLEFDNVYIVGLEEGLFPGVRSMGDYDEMEEERRLCYVGMTRAKKRLTLCRARQRMLFGKTSSNPPSRFLEEIPEKLIDCRQSPQNYDFGGGYSEHVKPTVTFRPPIPAQKSEVKALPEYQTGDRVEHRAFGVGVITSMQPVGGDALIEIRFGDLTKKFMLRAASRHMTKI